MVSDLTIMLKPSSDYPPKVLHRCISENMSGKLLAKDKNQEELPEMKLGQRLEVPMGNLDLVRFPK